MAGTLFKRDVKLQTGISWDEWVTILGEDCGGDNSNEQVADYLKEVRQVDSQWAELMAGMYGQRLGRKPVGQTADVGFQIGVRRTADVSKELVWDYLLSPGGLRLWIGEVSPFPIEAGSRFHSLEGVHGKLGVVKPCEKLRMSWQRKDWENPSTLQIYLLSTKAGKTTISFHQEKLDDLYMREMMRLHWEKTVETLFEQIGSNADTMERS